MMFIYTKGQFTTFMGRMFAYGKPVEVTDRATIAALLKHAEFERIEDEAKVEETPAPTVLKRPVLTARKAR